MLVAGATGGVGQLATAKLLEVRQRQQKNRKTTEHLVSCAVDAIPQTLSFPVALRCRHPHNRGASRCAP